VRVRWFSKSCKHLFVHVQSSLCVFNEEFQQAVIFKSAHLSSKSLVDKDTYFDFPVM